MKLYLAFVFVLLLRCDAIADELQRIEIAGDGGGFVEAETGNSFTPWGFNYDHDADGRLLEDYWIDEWWRVEQDFAEMRQMGANTVRIHLQFGKFMDGPRQPNQKSLDQLAALLQLAKQQRLYLNLTGLGCYHKQDVPVWYNSLDEAGRWEAQGQFWEAVAKQCNESPAVFCYDLMNEPVVPGGDKAREDWLGAGFAGKYFVQFITLDRAGRERPEIAKDWIRRLVKSIRKHDDHHLITVGLVPWSLDRPGLTSGFVPVAIAADLDFLSVHLYPESEKVDEALSTLEEFARVGKPVVIEEFFPLKCSISELDTFIDRSRVSASGWYGFYWGRTTDELSDDDTIGAALTKQWLELFKSKLH